MNARITAKERGLLKGAVRRVFSRSDLRQLVLQAHTIEHHDPKRARVKRWAWCNQCGEVVPRHTCAVDHVSPIVPIDSALENMSWDDLINALWCDRVLLQVLCDTCHREKTRSENFVRRQHKKARKNER